MMRVRFFSQRMSIIAATSRIVASTMRLTPPRAFMVVKPLVIRQNDQRADKRLDDRSLAAAQADAAKHGGRQHDHLEPDADIAANRAQAGGEEETADAVSTPLAT